MYTLLVYKEGCSEKIGGRNKTAAIDDSKFGRRKFIGATLLWGSECLAVLSTSVVKRFSFSFRT